RRYPQHVAALVPVDGPISVQAFVLPGSESGGPPQFPDVSGPEGLDARETAIRAMFTPDTSAEVDAHVLRMMLAAPEATAVGALRAMGDEAVWADATIPM